MAEALSVKLMNEIEISGNETSVRGRTWIWLGMAIFLGAFALLMGSQPAEAIDDQNDYNVVGSEVWDLAGNPDGRVVINGTLWIDTGGVLVVDGITVAFNNTWELGGPVPQADGVSGLAVIGRLDLVNGAVITSNAQTACGDGCDFDMIVVNIGTGSWTDSTISYSTSVQVDSSTMTIERMTIWNPNGPGIEFGGYLLTITDSVISMNGRSGIFVQDYGSPIVTLTRTRVDDNAEDGLRAEFPSPFTLNAIDTTFDRNTIGINIMAWGPVDLDLVGGSASNNGGDGISISGTGGGSTFVALSGVSVDTNVGAGLSVAASSHDLFLTLSTSSFSNNGGMGVYVGGGLTLSLILSGSSVDSNGWDNVYVAFIDGGILLDVSSSSASGGPRNGLALAGQWGGNLTATLDQFTATGNGLSGVFLGDFYASGAFDGSVVLSMTASTLTGNVDSGLTLVYTSRDARVDVWGSNLSGNGGSSLAVGTTNGDLTAVLDTSTFADAGGVGVGFIQVGGFADIAITGSDLSRAGSFGLLMVDVYGGLSLTINGSSLSDNQQSNLFIQSVWSGGAWMSITDSIISESSNSGLAMGQVYGGGATLVLTNTQLINNQVFGAAIDGIDGSLDLQISDSSVVGNGVAGIAVFSVQMAGVGDLSTVTLTNTLFQDNDFGGFYLGDVDNGNLMVTANSVTFADHGQFGFYREYFNGGPGILASYSFTDTTVTNTSNGVGIGMGGHDGGDASLFLGGDLTLTRNGAGLYMDWISGGGLSITTSLTSGNISGNSGEGVYVSGYDNGHLGSLDVSMTGVTADNNGGNGIYLLGGGCFPVSWYSVVLTGSSFSNNGGSGFYVDCVQVSGSVDAVVDVSNVVVDGNGGHGVYLGPASPLSPAQFSGFLPGQRFGTSAIYDGQYAYIFGGFDCWIGCETNQILEYDLIAGTTTVLPSVLPSARGFTAAVWDGSQYAYIFGGASCWFGCFNNQVVRFEPATGNVAVVANLYNSWNMAGFSAVWDDTRNVAYLFGGQADWGEPRYEIFEFDPITGSVNHVGDMPWIYRTFTSAVWDGQYAYIFGGTDTCYWGCWQSDQVVRFDPSNGNAQIVAYGPSVSASSAVLINGQVWVFGGDYCWLGCATSDVWVFDTTTYSYSYAGFGLPVQRFWASAVTDGTNAYLFGGAYPWDAGDRVVDIIIPTRTPTLTASITNSGLTDNGCHGFYLGEWFGDDTVTTSGMTATGNGCHGFYFGGTDSSTTNSVTMLGDTVDSNGESGIWIGDIYGSVDLRPAAAVDLNGCYGIYVASVDGGDFTLDLAGLGASGNGCSGVWLGELWYGSLTALFGGATFSQNGGSGAVLLWDNCFPLTVLVLDIATTHFDDNADYGFYMDCISGPGLDITLDLRTYTGNGNYALYFGGVNYGAVRMSVTNSQFVSNGGGIHFPDAWDIPADGAFSIVFEDNIVDAQLRCCEDGVWIGSLSNGWVDGTVSVQRNTLMNHGGDGLWIGGIDGCATCWPANTRVRSYVVDVLDNTISSNNDNGIYISNIDTADATITAARNDVSSNGGDGFNLDNIDEAGRTTLWVTDSTFDQNGRNGVSLPYMEDVGAWLSATLTNLVLTDNGQWGCCYAGIYLGEPEYGPIEFLVDTVSVSGSYYGIYLQAAASPFVGTIRSASVVGAVYGLMSDGGDNGAVQVTLWNSTVTGSVIADLNLNRGTNERFTLVNSPYDTRAMYLWADCGLYGNPSCSWILHQWFYHVQVLTGATLSQPAPGALVSIEENGMLRGVYVTDANGMVSWLIGSEWAFSVPLQVYYTTTVGASNGVVTAAVSEVVDTNGMTITVLLGGDMDADGVPDLIDNDDDNDGWADTQDAFPENPLEWLDTDSDGIGNNADLDDDNDGVVDAQDACPENSMEYLDTDSDGVCDSLDADDDNDGVPDTNDAFPVNPLEWQDLDGDGIGNYLDPDDDGDSVTDVLDAFPEIPGEWLDTDSDGIGNNADDDDDNDGTSDANDAFPDDATEWRDLDGDGVGDAADSDDDGDGVPDTTDPLPDNPNEWVDTDLDGLGDNADNDDDNDGVSDANDAFPGDATEWRDLDGDGLGDALDTDDDGDGVADSPDPFQDNPTEWVDTDGDGIGDNRDTNDDGDLVPDANDDFPTDPAHTTDTDSDGLPDGTDPDDDNDGMPDTTDPQPLIANPLPDMDGDGTLDITDTDDDGDGVVDTTDLFPANPSEWTDTDSDGFGNNADVDDDGDGWSDLVELQLGTDPLLATQSPVDTDSDGVADAQDADIDGDGVFNESDDYPFDATRSQAPIPPDPAEALLAPLYALVILAVVAVVLLLLFFLRKPRRPFDGPVLDGTTPPQPLAEPKTPDPLTTIDGPLQEPGAK